MAEAALTFPRSPEQIYYPESDGEPMAETDEHRDELAEIVFTLQHYFRDRDDVYVSGNLFIYYEEGDPKKRRAPDVFVVFGVPKDQRRIYRLWEEGRAPVVAIELTSKKTKEEDQKAKPALYGRLGIEYLFLYDVLDEYLETPLQGMRLARNSQPVPIVGPSKGPLPCPPLGLDLILDENGRLQFVDRETGELVVRVREARRQAEARAEQAEARAEQEAESRRQAEAEIERLRARLKNRDGG